ncbi:MAG TPA: hypothetical protein VI299_29870 [Polyangiales bacterium]
MTTGRWAALLGAALTALAGCGDVESCLEGQQGCVNGAPDDSGNCKFGLVVSADGLTCVNPSEKGKPPVDTCMCPSGQLCRNGGGCVDVCQPLTNVPAARPTPQPCRAPKDQTESFARAALAACTQACIHRAAICGTKCDPTTECTQLGASTAARAACQGNEDISCAIMLCERARDMPCDKQQCPPGSTPNCANITCSNTCDMPEYNNDGICDDGDLSSAISYVCDYGTDCGDCGPRRGTAPPFMVDFGDPCVDPAQCGGDLTNVKSSKGWCVPADSAQDYSRCLPDCSNGKTCHAGFECVGVAQDVDGSGPMAPTQVVDLKDGTPVFACFPLQCGN